VAFCKQMTLDPHSVRL